MPGATTTVLYPAGASTLSTLYHFSFPRLTSSGTKFNMDYYMSTHMPLVYSKWSQYGLKSWRVLQMSSDAPYLVAAMLEWGDLTEFQKAAQGPEVQEVMGDVKNFADKEPVLFTGSVEGTS